jgi:DNA-binding transcriptional LysR family regulator
LRVGAFLTACASFVPAAIATFAARASGRRGAARPEPPVSVPRLIDGDLDLAVVYIEAGAITDPRLDGRKLADDPCRVALPPGHRLARRREVRLADLRGERFSAPQGAGLRYREMLERLCREAGFAPDFAYAVDDVTAARGFVAAGLTVAVIPDMTIPPPRPDVAVKPLRGIDPARTVHVLSVRGRRTPGSAPMIAALSAAASRRLA